VIVLDASAVLDWLLNTPARWQVEQRMFAPGQTLHAPELLDIEVMQGLRRSVRLGVLDERRAEEALADFLSLDVRRHPHVMLLARIWHLRHHVTAYDAAYLVLAEILRAPLVTRDRRLAAAPGHRATVEVI
jgi:predicted nucleic acid-binding protein